MAERKGYIRPSPIEIDIDTQFEALKKAGAEKIFEEKALSKEADRPELRRALDSLCNGDTLIVASLDRLARTITELFYILEEIRRKGALLESLKEQLEIGDDFMRHLGIIIDFERSSLMEWQRETIEAKKSRQEKGTFSRRRR
ncbi:MAG: DNA-invertase hin [Spirochaetes bacterium ADurb.Bin110]|jgi:DNA invertase Pin-like site-specific DNA recombinase|nr:MAG: DNA-invertase hin [Spirochaetes bacterium ADurb.Bin110]